MKLYQRRLQTHHAHDRKLKGSAFANIWECRHVPGILKWQHTFLLPHHKSDMKYNRFITGLNATRQTPNVTLEESKRPLFLVLFAALDVTVKKSRSKAQGLLRLFMKNLTDISVIHVTILFRWNPSWTLLWILPFYLWNVCYLVCFFFCLFVFCEHLACFLFMQSKVKYDINSEHTHINHICERIQHAAFAHAKRPNDHSHSCTSVRGASTSTNHLCRCKWKDKIRSQVLTVTTRKKVEGKSRVRVEKKKCNVASWWQLPAGIKLLLCKQCPRRCKIHYFLIIFLIQKLAVLLTDALWWVRHKLCLQSSDCIPVWAALAALRSQVSHSVTERTEWTQNSAQPFGVWRNESLLMNDESLPLTHTRSYRALLITA